MSKQQAEIKVFYEHAGDCFKLADKAAEWTGVKMMASDQESAEEIGEVKPDRDGHVALYVKAAKDTKIVVQIINATKDAPDMKLLVKSGALKPFEGDLDSFTAKAGEGAGGAIKVLKDQKLEFEIEPADECRIGGAARYHTVWHIDC